jgi:hypothetical protein
LEHPATGEKLDLSAPLPEDMSDLLQFLRKYDQGAGGLVASGATRRTGETERG